MLKTFKENDKILDTSIFFFSNNVFKHFFIALVNNQ